MPVAKIYRPKVKSKHTTLPNTLFNFGHYYPDLEMQDACLLTHLFSKFDYEETGKLWEINHSAIASAIKSSVWAVKDSFSKLIQLGWASFKRFADGRTEWTIRVPERYNHIINPPPIPDAPAKKDESPEPQFVPPTQAVPDLAEPTVSIRTSLLENTSTTTNAAAAVVVVVEEEVKELPIPASFTESEVKTAKRELAKLPSHALQMAVLAQTAQAILAKKARTPLKYLLGLVNLALKGEFDMPSVPENVEAIKKAKKNDQERVIQGIVNRNKEKIIADLEAKGFVHFHGLGNFTRDALKPYLR